MRSEIRAITIDRKIESQKNRSVRLRSAGQVTYADQLVEETEETVMDRAPSIPTKPSKQPVEIKPPERKPVATARLSTDILKALLQVQEQINSG